MVVSPLHDIGDKVLTIHRNKAIEGRVHRVRIEVSKYDAKEDIETRIIYYTNHWDREEEFVFKTKAELLKSL